MRRPLVILLILLVASAINTPLNLAFAQAKQPSISIAAPKSGQTLSGAEVEIKVKVSNFKLDAKAIGGVNKAGSGHLSLLIDGTAVDLSEGNGPLPRTASPSGRAQPQRPLATLAASGGDD